MFNPISLTVPFYAYHRIGVFSRIYDEEFGKVKFDNPSIVSFQRNPKARIVSYCTPVSETYRFFSRKDDSKIRRDMLVISFLSAFYDSLFDEDYNPSSIEFTGRLFNGEKIDSKNDLENLVCLALGKLESSIARERKGLYDCLNRIQELQIEGLNQRRDRYANIPSSSREEYLRHITLSKGACAFLTYSFVANPELDDEILIKDIEKIGSYLQVVDDMLDVYKDFKDGNITLITEEFIDSDEIEERAQYAFELLNKRFLPSPTKQIVLQALRIMHKEGLRKIREFRKQLPEATTRLHKIALLFK
jgi:hypothetical protein